MVEHYIPTSLKDTLSYLNTHKTTIISGGTDLMVQRRNWAELPPFFSRDVVYIFNLKELQYIKEDDFYVYIGANFPMSQILNSTRTPTILKQAIEIIASPALRNMATIAGNIGNASPAGDTLPILYVLNATLKLESIDGSRLVPINEFILGPRKIALQENELITEIHLPKVAFTKTVFNKVGGRKADAISKVSFTGAVTIRDSIVEDFRIAYGAVGPVIRRSTEIESHYIGKTVHELKQLIEQMKIEYKPLITPIDDQRSNKAYRLQVALNLLEQFIHSL